jgi:hypothetical protein
LALAGLCIERKQLKARTVLQCPQDADVVTPLYSQYAVERPGHEDVLHRRHQDQRDDDTESCHDLCVDEAFTVRSIAVVDAVQCPTNDADDDDRAAELRDAEDDVRDPESNILIHAVISLVQMSGKLPSCIFRKFEMDLTTQVTVFVRFQVDWEKQQILNPLVTEIKAARNLASRQLTLETST